MMYFNVFVLLAVCAAVVAEYTPEALADQITSLPGAENIDINFNQFSGYLKVGGTKNMHYWLVESMNDPASDPVAFWTNGGPGCSGLLGFFTEQGPFRPNKDLTLSINPYSWNTISNMVFIEAPCGVGFSYSDQGTDPKEADDLHNDDLGTAKDNYEMIQAFLDRFPQFRTNDLYITSESYGGHYMPTLAKEIVDQNAVGEKPKLNFKGFAVGNPATTFYSAIPAGLDTYWGHQLISQPLWDQYVQSCKIPKKSFEQCEMIFLAMYRQVGNLNPYALDYPVCTEDSIKRVGRSQRTWLLNFILDGLLENGAEVSTTFGTTRGVNATEIAAMQPTASDVAVQEIRNLLKLEPVDGYEPCEEDYMTNYLEQQSVREAIHVKTDLKWADCSRTLRYKQSDGKNDMTSYYNYLIDGGFGLNILVYSGDDDDVCATIGTQSWIWDLGYEIATDSKTGVRKTEEWVDYTVNGQTAGYITKWQNTKLAFATVHGAGHEVPTYKPDVALYLWQHYLAGELTNM